MEPDIIEVKMERSKLTDDDHDLIIRLDQKMDMVLERLEKGDTCMDELKNRVSKLESFQATILGIAATISAGITILGDKISKAFFGG